MIRPARRAFWAAVSRFVANLLTAHIQTFGPLERFSQRWTTVDGAVHGRGRVLIPNVDASEVATDDIPAR